MRGLRAARWPAAAGALLIAVNLRPAVASLSPLLPQVRADLGLSRAFAGLLTTVPVLCFGLLAPVATRLGRRAGLEWALLWGMVLLVAGIVLRSSGGLMTVLVGTVVLGAGITVGNVLVPALVKRDFAATAGRTMALYMTFLTAGAALAGGLTGPLESGFALGWRGGLALWAVLAFVATLTWLPTLRARDRGIVGPGAAGITSVWRSGRARALAVFMGMQSGAFYAVLAWLPALLDDHGYGTTDVAVALSLYNILGVLTALATPSIAARMRSQAGIAAVIGAGWLLGLLGLLFAPGAALVWSAVMGLAQGAGISLATVLMVLRASSVETARDLSGMSQTLGYALAALAPYAVGLLRDASGSWSAPLVLLIGVVVVMAVAGVIVGRPGQIE